jgi:RNA binding exosome subunit
MKLAHNVKLSVFAYDTEDAARISAKLAALCPFGLKEEKLNMKSTTALGFNERKIMIFEITLTKEKHISKFLNCLNEKFSDDQRSLLVNQSESRLDSDLNFFIRLDKPRWLDEDRLWITDSGDCFHMRIAVAAFPAKRESALKVIEDWLK